MRLAASVCVVVILLVVACGAPWADTIYDNGSFQGGGAYSDITGLQIAADDFTLSKGASISGIEFWGIYLGTSPTSADNFTLVFYEDDGGLPDNDNIVDIISLGDLTATVADAGGSVYGTDIYRYQVNLPTDVQLDAGTYWVSVYNDTSADTVNASKFAGWLWAIPTEPRSTRPTKPSRARLGTRTRFPMTTPSIWLAPVGLTPVPEPTSLALFGLGIGGIVMRRRKKKLA